MIGGYQEGGDTASVSYSSYLGQDVLRLYREAAAAGASPAGYGVRPLAADHPGAAGVEWSQSDSSVRMPVISAMG
jgi:hypothetical protein